MYKAAYGEAKAALRPPYCAAIDGTYIYKYKKPPSLITKAEGSNLQINESVLHIII